MYETTAPTWPAPDASHWTRVRGCDEQVAPTGWCDLPAGHPLPHMRHLSNVGWVVTAADRR